VSGVPFFIKTTPNHIDCKELEKQSVLTEFDFSRYLGTWYELYHTKDMVFEKNCRCTHATYSQNEDGTIKVDNICYKKNVLEERVGKAYISGNASLEVSFGLPFTAPYDITYISDNYQYVAILSCSNLPYFGGVNMWILSRDPHGATDVEEINEIFAHLRSKGLKDEVNKLVETNQTKCYEYAEHYHYTNITNFKLRYMAGSYNVISSISSDKPVSCDRYVLKIKTDNEVEHICYHTKKPFQVTRGYLYDLDMSTTRHGIMVYEQTKPTTREIYSTFQILSATDDYKHILLLIENDKNYVVLFITRSHTMPLDVYQYYQKLVFNNGFYEPEQRYYKYRL